MTLPGGAPYTYSVAHSNWPQLDVVGTFVAAMKKYNISYGFYYSIANNVFLNVQSGVVQPANTLQAGMANVTQDEFFAIAEGHLRELWSTYGGDGAIFEHWFDGGLPLQYPDFTTAVVQLKNELQPNAMVRDAHGVILALLRAARARARRLGCATRT